MELGFPSVGLERLSVGLGFLNVELGCLSVEFGYLNVELGYLSVGFGGGRTLCSVGGGECCEWGITCNQRK
ncbi:hypothetical protein JOM49_002526 [Amycolatopsis magusensis]|uniref:Uncharacterized protein n=1 Tax=Amycolatopsis magusensis TaxID=882444 RepID=A0ABS4PNL5_9PSEU|nr:hypothetical protein [Amycolatopsis magusensis]